MSVLQGSVYVAELVSGTDLTGSTVTATVTAPDGTNVPATVSVATSSPALTATVTVTATLVGTYLIVWTTTGTVTGVVQDQFTAVAPSADLISLPDLKDELNLSPTDTSKDAKLRRWLRAAGDVVENVTGPIRPHSRVDVFDGNVESVTLTSRWVISLTSVVETWVSANYPLTEQPLGFSVNAFGYTWDRNTQTIVRRTFGGAPALFQPGIRTVAVTYQAGLATIPDDIQVATAELIKHWYRKSEVAFRTPTFGAAGGDDAYNMPGNYMVPNAVMELLEPWRRPPGIF